MPLSDLNHDCLQGIVGFCADNDRALYQLMQVSKSWFSLVVPAMYRECLVDRTLSDFSRNRLEYLIGINSGYVQGMYENQASRPPFWKNPPTLPTTVDYFSFVRKMWSTTFPLQSWQGPIIGGQTIADYFHHRLRVHVNCHGPKFISDPILMPETVPVIFDFVSRLPQLAKVDFRSKSYSSEYTAEELQMIEGIVSKHAELFPGVLQTVTIAFQDQHWDFYTRLQRILQEGPPKGTMATNSAATTTTTTVTASRKGPVELNIQLHTSANLLALPLENVKTVNFYHFQESEDNLIDVSEFLSRCRKLESISIHDGMIQDHMFAWARTEQEKLEAFQRPNHRPASRCLPPPTSSLVPLKNLQYCGPCSSIRDAISGFRTTLQNLDLDHSDYTGERPEMSFDRWGDFQLPNLVSLKTQGLIINDLDFLYESCPKLQSLSIVFKTVVPMPTLKNGFPPLLKHLTLMAYCHSNIDLVFFKPLVHLETLHLWTNPSDEQVIQLIDPPNEYSAISKENGWWFPAMHKVTLVGIWVIRFQGALIRVCPKLTKCGLEFPRAPPFNHLFDLNSMVPDSFCREPTTMANKDHFRGYRPFLTHLNLTNLKPRISRNSHHGSAVDLTDLVTMFPNLEELDFFNFSWPSREEMDKVFELAMRPDVHQHLAKLNLYERELDDEYFETKFEAVVEENEAAQDGDGDGNGHFGFVEKERVCNEGERHHRLENGGGKCILKFRSRWYRWKDGKLKSGN